MTESEWLADDFSTYNAMKQSGSSPDEVYRAAVRDGVDTVTMFRLLRSVFSLGLAEAKEIILRGLGWANSLIEYQDELANMYWTDEDEKGKPPKIDTSL